MTDEEKISKWIEEQQSKGKTKDDLAGTVFVRGTTIFKLMKGRGKKFDLKIFVGAHDLDKMYND